jgi:hypothetical protein
MFGHRPSPSELAEYLQSHNVLTHSILVSGEPLSDREKQENFDAIRELLDKVQDGYPCSTSDPVLCLVCELFLVNIEHSLCGATTQYIHFESKKQVVLNSSSCHCNFQCCRDV